jgi:hypothetical protein
MTQSGRQGRKTAARRAAQFDQEMFWFYDLFL